jgi:hypothetical protein
MTELVALSQHFADQVQYVKVAAPGSPEAARADAEQRATHAQAEKTDAETALTNKRARGPHAALLCVATHRRFCV